MDRQAGARGATLIEVLVALTLGTTVLAGAIALAFGSQQLFRRSDERASINQAMRTAADLVGNQIREAGHLLPADFPAVEVVDGPFGTPDELVLRQGLSSIVMPLCADLSSGATRSTVTIADGGGSPPPGCTPVADTDTDGWPDNLQAWDAQRVAAGGTLNAYIYDPVNRVGEFFELSGEDETNYLLNVGNGGTWDNAYTVAAGSRIYVLIERRFRLTGDLLEIVVDGDGAAALGVQNLIEDFQVRVTLQDASVVTALAATDDWGEIDTIEVTFDGLAPGGDAATERSLTTRFNPRNTLSL